MFRSISNNKKEHIINNRPLYIHTHTTKKKNKQTNKKKEQRNSFTPFFALFYQPDKWILWNTVMGTSVQSNVQPLLFISILQEGFLISLLLMQILHNHSASNFIMFILLVFLTNWGSLHQQYIRNPRTCLNRAFFCG